VTLSASWAATNHSLEFTDCVLKLGRGVVSGGTVRQSARDVSEIIAMRIGVGGDYAVTNGVSNAADLVQFLGDRRSL